MSEPVQVVGAVIVSDGLILCAQRDTGPLAGLWEFPGGKIEPGEGPRAALAREIAEELGCRIEVGEELVTASHAYDFATITMTTYRCRIATGAPSASEHSALRWVAPDALAALEWAPLDLPTVEQLTRRG